MASTSFYLDRRYDRADGKFTLKIKVSLKGNRGFLVNTSVRIGADQWENNQVVRHENRQMINQYLRQQMNRVNNALFALSSTGETDVLPSAEIKRRLESDMSGRERGSSFTDHFAKTAESREKPSTREIYRQTLLKIRQFDGRDLTFAQVNYAWLRDFERWLLDGGISVNSVSIHLRNVRSVFNDAINLELAPQNSYPFRRFKIRSEKTRKRSLTVEELRRLRDLECDEHQRQYRDIFMLIFYLGGINIIDLCHLTEMRGGYVEYRRAKTGRLYKIKVMPQAEAIIKRYRGRKYLLDILERYPAGYKNYLQRLNHNLKEMGLTAVGKHGRKTKTGLFPELSTYWARHTWATVAASLDIPKETIAATLGHGGNSVTDIYIDFDQRKIDRAIEQVAEYVDGL